jgi:Ca-activated chloride channel family protein
MNSLKLIFTPFLLFVCIICSAQDDNNESPYFQVVGENSKIEFPLLTTNADVNITGPIADVVLTQQYQNKGEEPIEAIYVFPASTRSAVYDMEMYIGDRVIKAKVQEKQQARITYQKAKEEGKRASLLEQHRPNVFQMNVANIMPGEIIKVVMKYTEFLIPEDQEYSFHFPTVVGPRYTGERSADWAAQPYSKSGKPPTSTFDINISIHTSIPIAAISCPSHKTSIKASSFGLLVELEDDGKGGNRDFILEYRLSDKKIETGIQTFSVNDENFFLCQVEPPSLTSNPEIAPREYIFIMDVSGSMRGYPLQVSKQLMRNLFGNLRPSDKFNIMFFAGSAFALSATSLYATKSNVSSALKKVDRNTGGGGTNMLGAIKKAMASPKEDGYSRSFVIITDGYVSVEEEAFDYVHQHLEDSNFFAFGIGSSVNRHLIEGLAHVGRARPFIVTNQSEAQHQANRLRKYIEHPVLTEINITGQGVDLYDLVPDHIPDLMAGRPIYFFGKYKNANNAYLEINGQNGCTPFYSKLNLPTPSDKNSALAQLWARETIKHLDDYNSLRSDQKRIDKITKLGIDYNLLTKYTSFVAVDHEIVNSSGAPKVVKQVLPMPQGVSNTAIGFEMEVEEMTHNFISIKKVVDITVETNRNDLKQVAELLLEAILSEKLAHFDQTERTINIKTNPEGKLVSEVLDDDIMMINLFLDALQKYGISIDRLDFSIHISQSK